MKNLFNDISREEKNRILEMHSGKENVISEQSMVDDAKKWVKDKLFSVEGGGPSPLEKSKLWKRFEDGITGAGVEITNETPNQLIINVLGKTWILTAK